MKLSVSNFQIHKANTVAVPEGEITYLQGDSDTGKSAMLRAIRWLCENKPDGGSFVTFKTPRGTTSVVTLEVDGHTITRERGKSKNLYTLDGETFEAFGRTVPEPIAKVLKLSPYAFQLQGEQPFLIGFSPTEAAKVLSDACGLGVIDTAVAFVRAKKAVAEADIRKCEILMESAQAKLTAAEKQLPLAEALEKAAEIGEGVAASENKRDAARLALEDEPAGEVLDIAAAQGKADLARFAGLAWRAELNRAVALRAALSDAPKGAVFELSGIQTAVTALKDICTECAGLRSIADKLTQTLAAEPLGSVYDVGAAHNKHSLAVVLFGEMADLSKMAQTMQAVLHDEPFGDMVDTTELKQQRAQIKVCPTCGKEL